MTSSHSTNVEITWLTERARQLALWFDDLSKACGRRGLSQTEMLMMDEVDRLYRFQSVIQSEAAGDKDRESLRSKLQ